MSSELIAKLREVLDGGKHIMADRLHGVEYSDAQLWAWIGEAESALFETRGPDGL